jgi:hypothetical protein
MPLDYLARACEIRADPNSQIGAGYASKIEITSGKGPRLDHTISRTPPFSFVGCSGYPVLRRKVLVVPSAVRCREVGWLHLHTLLSPVSCPRG